ncbi:hypothetical protein FQN54_009208 [Arachnomyces sp. PD_36]|nr:hypothetical protein FQN54_009208 [Arachnomyces sp. PD_36]
METSPAPPSDAGSQNIAREPAKYRASCDRCQDIKVRCSRDKPACKICARKGVKCVYSPMRRMGRPRNASQIPCQNTSLDGNTENRGIMAEAPDSGLSNSSYRQSDHSASLSSTSSVTTPMATLQDSGESSMRDTPMTGSYGGSTSEEPEKVCSSQVGRAPLTGDKEVQHHQTIPWALDRHLSAGTHTGALAQASNTETCTRPPDSNWKATFQAFLSGPGAQNAPDAVADCYLAILTRSAKLEQSLLTVTRAPPIDLVLQAERDLRALGQRLFTCSGHGHSGGRDCLSLDRPVTLSFALLAERIVTMLEETFRLAAETATGGGSPIQDPCGNALPATTSRRLERSFRGLLALPCVFPMPAANIDIQVGGHLVEGLVKARAVKRILQLRIRNLMSLLENMRRIPRRGNRSDTLGGPLDWGGSSAVLDDAARLLADDLTRRLEALQGGLTLMGGDF